MTTPVDTHGFLKVSGTDIVDSAGQIVRLRGVSSHGLQWFPRFINPVSLGELRDKWGLNVVRLAMYTTQDGYLDGNLGIKDILFQKVEAAISAGVYCIIDWHMLLDNNPLVNVGKAALFFDEVAQKYAGLPNVLFEICNEPNGYEVNWDNVIHPYAETISAVIRKYTQGIIIVGNPNWSQQPNAALSAPLSVNNVMYTLHWYAGTHYQDIRDNLQAAHDGGFAVFCTEWSISDAAETKTDTTNADIWMALIDKLGLSWTSWSFCDKWEPSSILEPGANPYGPFTDTALTKAGLYVKAHMAT